MSKKYRRVKKPRTDRCYIQRRWCGVWWTVAGGWWDFNGGLWPYESDRYVADKLNPEIKYY